MKTLVDFRGNPRVIVAAFVLGLAALFGAPQGAHAADCSAGKSMSVIAHPDDDLLFQSPDILHDLYEDKCMEAVYVTAGDAGLSLTYADQRQAGIEAAYAQMDGKPDSWTRVTVSSYGHLTELSTLRSDPRITLRFFSLPDGNPLGSGFSAHHDESLEKLWNGDIPSIQTIDASDSYTRQDLINALKLEMDQFQPDVIRTLNYEGAFGADYETHSPTWDHSDHLAVGRFTYEADQAYDAVSGRHTIIGYVGSGPGDDMNISGADLEAKKAAFYTYGGFDAATHCTEDVSCSANHGQYPRLLAREHVAAESDRGPDPPTSQLKVNTTGLSVPVRRAQPVATSPQAGQSVVSDQTNQKTRTALGTSKNDDFAPPPPAVANSPPAGSAESTGYRQHVWASMRRD